MTALDAIERKLRAASWRPHGAFWRHTDQQRPPIREEHAMTVTFDPVHYKDTTRARWKDAATAWHASGPTLEDWLGEAAPLMLDAAGITTGSTVLDVAAGAGGQLLAAARRVGQLPRAIPPVSADYGAMSTVT